jgi:hypothetical protein
MFLSYLVATCGFLKGAAIGAALAVVTKKNCDKKTRRSS